MFINIHLCSPILLQYFASFGSRLFFHQTFISLSQSVLAPWSISFSDRSLFSHHLDWPQTTYLLALVLEAAAAEGEKKTHCSNSSRNLLQMPFLELKSASDGMSDQNEKLTWPRWIFNETVWNRSWKESFIRLWSDFMFCIVMVGADASCLRGHGF